MAFITIQYFFNIKPDGVNKSYFKATEDELLPFMAYTF